MKIEIAYKLDFYNENLNVIDLIIENHIKSATDAKFGIVARKFDRDVVSILIQIMDNHTLTHKDTYINRLKSDGWVIE